MTYHARAMRPGFERLFLAWAWSGQVLVIAALAAHALLTTKADSSFGVLSFGTPLAVAGALSVIGRLSHRGGRFASAIGVAGASLALIATGSWIAVLVLAGLMGAVLAESLAGCFPAGLDGVLRRRRVMAILTGLVALLGLGRGTLLALFMADSDQVWASTAASVEDSVEHQCLAAYLHAGELNARGMADVYDPSLYPFEYDQPCTTNAAAAVVEKAVDTAVVGMEEVIEDPFLYPPPFLLLPRAALALTRDFALLRLGVYAANAIAFLVVGLALAGWIGGQRGLVAAMLLPLVWSSIPVLFNLQFGQFHLMALVLSMGAMLAFERQRHALGGALLAIAVLCKVFPAVLGLWLLSRGAWRAAAWTLGWGIVLIGLSFPVVGYATFEHFVLDQIPRLVCGDAPPYFKESINGIGSNISVYGLPFKLRALGCIENAGLFASLLNWGFSIVLVAIAYHCGRRKGEDRHTRALTWLALVALASLRSPLLPSTYGYAGAIWLLSLLAPLAAGRAWRIAAVVGAWVLLVPLPPGDNAVLTVLPSLFGPLIFLLVGLTALRAGRLDEQPGPAARSPIARPRWRSRRAHPASSPRRQP